MWVLRCFITKFDCTIKHAFFITEKYHTFKRKHMVSCYAKPFKAGICDHFVHTLIWSKNKSAIFWLICWQRPYVQRGGEVAVAMYEACNVPSFRTLQGTTRERVEFSFFLLSSTTMYCFQISMRISNLALTFFVSKNQATKS